MIPIPIHFHISISCFNRRSVRDTSFVEICRPYVHEYGANQDVFQNTSVRQANRNLGSRSSESYPKGTARGQNSNRFDRHLKYRVDSVTHTFARCPDCKALESEVASLVGEEVKEVEDWEPEISEADGLYFVGHESQEDDELEEDGGNAIEFCEGMDEEPDIDKDHASRVKSQEHCNEGNGEDLNPSHFQQQLKSRGARQSKQGSGRFRRQTTLKNGSIVSQDNHSSLFERNLVSSQPDINRQQLHDCTKELSPGHVSGEGSIPRKRKNLLKRVLNKVIGRLRGRNNQENVRHPGDSVPS